MGRALKNSQKKAGKPQGFIDGQGNFRYTTDIVDGATVRENNSNTSNEPGWVKLRSVTQENALDEFLSTAELAATDFTADRYNNVKIISTGVPDLRGGNNISGLPVSSFTAHNPYLLTPQQREQLEAIHAQNRLKLTVPRRPKWERGKTTATELDRLEREAFLDWRRQLANLQDNQDLLMTPFERNLEVWRQLWRVLERSDLVVQIVDARNPLFFRSEDLEVYVKEYDNGRKHNLLLINKADLLTASQRESWAEYFNKKGIRYAFFSAFTALQEQEASKLEEEQQEERERLQKLRDEEESESEEEDDEEEEEEEDDEEEDAEAEAEEQKDEKKETLEEPQAEEISQPSAKLPVREILQNNPIHILSVEQLEELFLTEIPPKEQEEDEEDEDTDAATKIQKQKRAALNIGLVGYPNVGKSSTINALIGAKKVSVSATPGKTKHFQTINLSPDVVLCDCPGLVFPNFSNTNAELVCNGVLPIDQLREFTGPADLITQRIPKFFLEAVYGITIFIRPLSDGGSGIPTASELLSSYARARGFMRAGNGSPDESRAARYIFKDYVNAKLLYCHPPPSWTINPEQLPLGAKPGDITDPEFIGSQFNSQLYKLSSLPESRRQQILVAIAKSRLGDTATVQSLLQSIQAEQQQKLGATAPKLTTRQAEDTIDLAAELETLSFSQHVPLNKLAGTKNLQLSAGRTANNQAVVSAGASFDQDFFEDSSAWGRQNLPFHKKSGKKGAAGNAGKHVAGGHATSQSKKDAKKKRRAGAAAGVGIYSDVY